jgi:hypothetical protein
MNGPEAFAVRSAGSRLARQLAYWLPLACVLLVGLGPGVAEARIYRYVDRDGASHFTDSLQQVPLEYRSQVRDISPEMEQMDGFRVVGGANGTAAGDKSAPAASPGDAGDLAGDLAAGEEVVSGLLESFGFGVILLGLLAIPVLYVVSALVFKLACRLAGEDPPGLGRACGILLAQGLAGGAASGIVSGIAMVMGLDESASIGVSLAVTASASLVSWLVNAAILSSMMSYDFLKSMWIGVLHTLLSILLVGGPIAALAGLAFLLA